MPDNDPDQLKLSQWWHNEYNRAWHTLETIQRLTTLGVHVHFFEIETLRGERGTWCELFDNDKSYEAFSPNFLDAFWRAKDEFDLRSGEGPGNVAESCESAPEQVEVEMAKGIGGVKGVLGVSILSK